MIGRYSAVFENQKLLWAGLSKDFSDVDNDPHLNWELVNKAKKVGGWQMPQQVVWYEIPWLKTLRQWWAGQGWLAKENNINLKKNSNIFDWCLWGTSDVAGSCIHNPSTSSTI